MMPSFSIVLPVYNVAPYLHHSMDSIIASADNYSGMVEIVCVDDGSSDDCGNILNEYAARDARVKVIHQPNAGVGAARQSALDILTCDWMLSVDPDDWIDVGYISEFARAISDNPSVDMVWCDYYVDARNNRVRVDNRCLDNPLEQLKSVIRPGGLWAALWIRAFRLEFIKKHHLRFCVGRQIVMEDLLFISDFLLKCPRIKWFDSCCYHYRQNELSLTHAGWNDDKFVRQGNVLKTLLDKVNDPDVRSCLFARIKLFLSGTYHQIKISDDAFKVVFPEIRSIDEIDVAVWHKLFYKLSRHGLRSLILRLLAVIRLIRRGRGK